MKHPTALYLEKFLDLMENAWLALDELQFRKLEDAILREIRHARKPTKDKLNELSTITN